MPHRHRAGALALLVTLSACAGPAVGGAAHEDPGAKALIAVPSSTPTPERTWQPHATPKLPVAASSSTPSSSTPSSPTSPPTSTVKPAAADEGSSDSGGGGDRGGGGGYSGGSWGWSPPPGWQPGIYDGPQLQGSPSPLSGLPTGKDTRILAVKIDNTPSAQPHVGLTSADLVYIQEVEGGLTRLLALYSTRKPNQIGPVRSARISDLEILAPYGKVAFAFSGAQRKLKHKIYNGNLYDLSEWRGPVGWFIDKNRPLWWNAHMLSPKHIMTRAPQAATAQDMGWEFSSSIPQGGRTVNNAVLRWPGSTVEFRYDPQRGNYIVWFNGAASRGTEASHQRASTVIIQRVRQTDSEFGDRYGGRTPYIHTVGKGKAWMLRDGKAWPMTWTKGRKKLTTDYRYENGQKAQFKPGQLWVALLPDTSSPSLT